MRIIGGHDYYDCGLAYGQDESVVFVRNEAGLIKLVDLKLPSVGCMPTILEEGEKRLWKSVDYSHFHRDRYFYFEVVHVIFCGYYFSGLRVSSSEKDVQVFWDHKSCDEFLRKKFGLHLLSEAAESKRYHRRWGSETSSRPFCRYKLEGEALDFIIRNNITVMTGTSRGDNFLESPDLSVNSDTLKNFQFYKIKDAWTAFQEISMWVSGVLTGSGRPMVKIADEEIRIHKAGFDARTSFRHQFKAKPNRKERKKLEAESK